MEIAATAAVSGLEQAQSRLDAAARRLANPSNPLDTVSLSDEAVALIQARTAFQLNVNVLKTSDRLQQSVLATLAGTAPTRAT